MGEHRFVTRLALSNKGAWFQTIYTPAVGEGCAGTAKKKASAKYFIEASCKEFTTRTKQTIYYAEDGSVLEYCGYNDPKAAFTEYAPETLGEFHFRAICDPKGRVKNRFALLVRESKPGNKPMFAQCEASSDCSGNLLCKPSGGTPTMRCFPPD